MTFQHVSGISLNYDDNIWERQSRCYKTVLKFHLWEKEMFSNWIWPGLIENSDVSSALLIRAAIFTCEHVDSSKVFQNGSFVGFK